MSGKDLGGPPADPPVRGNLFRKQTGGLDFTPDVGGPAKGVHEDRLAGIARLRDVTHIPVAGLAEPAGAEDERAQHANKSVTDLCRELFKDYQFGLNLIKNNAGLTEFVIPRSALADPDKLLSEWVVSSYHKE